MRKQILLFFFLGTQLFNAQTLLLQESFETDGEGTRYTSNSFNSACNDYFTRTQDSDQGTITCITNIPSNEDGTFFWGAEDSDQATGGEGVITLNPLTVTSYSVDVDILMAEGRAMDGRFEPADYFILEYNMDGGGWVIFGALYGNNDTSLDGDLAIDVDLDGPNGTDGATVNSTNFQNFNFTIPVTGNSLQGRFRANSSGGTEEIVFDNIRINGTTTLGVDDNEEFKNVTIYPNPSNGLINIDLATLKNPKINIYNTLGKLIYRKENIINSFFPIELNTSKGLYLIEIRSENSKQTYKLIIK